MFPTIKLCFNPHSHMGSDVRRLSRHHTMGCFNPHSHMGSDLLSLPLALAHLVSIHTPTWGVTTKRFAMRCLRRFQSTLPHGEWRHISGRRTGMVSFNPHSHMGSDWRLCWCVGALRMFQSTLPHGEWPHLWYKGINDFKFQSTLPHGEWLVDIADVVVAFWFQSTLPHGEWLFT